LLLYLIAPDIRAKQKKAHIKVSQSKWDVNFVKKNKIQADIVFCFLNPRLKKYYLMKLLKQNPLY